MWKWFMTSPRGNDNLNVSVLSLIWIDGSSRVWMKPQNTCVPSFDMVISSLIWSFCPCWSISSSSLCFWVISSFFWWCCCLLRCISCPGYTNFTKSSKIQTWYLVIYEHTERYNNHNITKYLWHCLNVFLSFEPFMNFFFSPDSL